MTEGELQKRVKRELIKYPNTSETHFQMSSFLRNLEEAKKEFPKRRPFNEVSITTQLIEMEDWFVKYFGK